MKISELENGNKDNCEKLHEEIQKKEEDIDILKKEIEKHEQSLESQGKKLNQFETILEERERLIEQQKEKEKELEDENAKVLKVLDFSIPCIFMRSFEWPFNILVDFSFRSCWLRLKIALQKLRSSMIRY